MTLAGAPGGRGSLRPLRARLIALSPAGPLAWSRLLFLLAAIGSAVLSTVLTWSTSAAPVSLRLAALVALAALVLWWWVCFRRGGFPLLAAPLEAGCLALPGMVLAEGTRGMGILYMSVALHVLYGSGRRAVFWVAVHLAAWFVVLALAPPIGDVSALGAVFAAGLVLVAAVLHQLGAALERYERGAAWQLGELRERLLRGESTALTKIRWLAVVGRPVEEVFPYMTDPRAGPEWQTWLVESRPEGPVGPGTLVTEMRHILGLRISSTYRITALEPNACICVESVTGPGRYSACVTFQTHGQGTLVTIDVDAELGAVATVGTIVLERAIRRQVEADLGSLNDLLQARAMERGDRGWGLGVRVRG